MNNKQLTKSNKKVISGVCGGIVEFLDWPASKVRWLWALITLFHWRHTNTYLHHLHFFRIHQKILFKFFPEAVIKTHKRSTICTFAMRAHPTITNHYFLS